jgi:hypothetical protein
MLGLMQPMEEGNHLNIVMGVSSDNDLFCGILTN